MNLVFLNSLEKRVGEDRVITGQVSIGEHEGKWHVLWSEPQENGRLDQQNWFEGHKWDEMLNVFRTRLMEKTAEGYIPLLGGTFESDEMLSGKAKYTQMLYYYSELNAREDVFQQLRQWRREQSSKEGKAPFILASDRILRMISSFLPQSKEELLQIPGLGENKVKIYGGDILLITGSISRSTNFPLDWVLLEIDQQQFKVWVYQQRELKMKNELDKQAFKRKLLEGISQGESLSSLQQKLNAPRRQLIQSIEQLDSEGYDVDTWIHAELQSVSPAEQEMAWKAFEQEGDRYLKPILKKVISDEQPENVDHVYEWLRLLRLRFRKEKGMGNQAS